MQYCLLWKLQTTTFNRSIRRALILRSGLDQDKLFIPESRFLNAILSDTQKYINGINKASPLSPDWQEITSCDPHFASGFFYTSAKTFHTPPFPQYEIRGLRLFKTLAAPDPDVAYLRTHNAPALIHLKQVSVLMNIALQNEALLKRTTCIQSHTDHFVTAAYQHICAAIDQEQQNGYSRLRYLRRRNCFTRLHTAGATT